MFLSLDLSLALLKYDWQTKTIHLKHTANDYIHTSCIPGCLRLIMQLSISLNVRSSCLHILRFGNTSQTFVQLLGCRDWIYGFISAGKMPDAHYLQPTHHIFLSIHLWTDPYIVSITLLLWMMLHWAWEYGQLLGILLHFIRINAHGQGYWKRREEVSVSSIKELLIDLLSNCVKLHLH